MPALDTPYRLLFERNPQPMWVLDVESSSFLAVNLTAIEQYGYSQDEFLRMTVLDIHPPEDIPALLAIFANQEVRFRKSKWKHRKKDGSVIDVEILSHDLDWSGRPARLVLATDISERLRAGQNLRRKELDLAEAQRIAHVGSYDLDLSNLNEIENNRLHWSDENFRVFGYEPGQIEVTGATFLNAVHPEDKERVQREINKGLRETDSIPLDYRIVRPDGNIRFIHSQSNVIRDASTHRPIRLLGIAQDVTKTKKAEEKFYKAFHANPEPMTIATFADGRFLDVNESFLRVTGHSRQDIIGRTSQDIQFWKSPEDRARFIEPLEKQGRARDLEISFLTKFGEERTALDSADLVELDGEKCIIAIFKDITERKSLEKQLRQAQKMEAIGQLSGGIAHDFNNLLGVIIGYSEILEERLAPDDRLQKNVKEIKKAGKRAASLTRQLLAFSRQQVLESKILDLNAIVSNVEKMLGRLIGENIDLTCTLGSDLWNVKADQGQIEQVILNLAVNARDAMPRGGRLTIATANVDLNEDYARLHPPQKPGQYVLLSVSDTGIGMDATTQAHIFEPFFTTKEKGKGTGLGLSTVYGVVRQSDGHIWVYSEPGLGTTFKIYMPRTVDLAGGEQPTAELATALRGRETILLVEDEEPLRELTCNLLIEHGYNVLSAERPDKALEIVRHQRGPIHLLLTDMVMPGMSGLDLAQKLAPAMPELKVVYMSGYTGFTHPDLFDSTATILFKPIPRSALLRKVREVLGLEAVLRSI